MSGPPIRPFWNYYGGKWRVAPRYSRPLYGHIVEPFAGAAGYSLRYPDLEVTLVDAYPVVVGIWRYLIGVSAAEVLRIPLVDSTDDLPAWVPQEARWLVGFAMNNGTTAPRRTLSAGLAALRETGCTPGWSKRHRANVARQVERIRHWKIIEGDYTAAPNVDATWFIDPPYQGRAGSYYRRKVTDYAALGEWCRSRRGHVMVCENVGADWLPFVPFLDAKGGTGGTGVSREAIWQSREAQHAWEPPRLVSGQPSLFGEPARRAAK